jgi:S-formylglutathione hydrolase FrmB
MITSVIVVAFVVGLLGSGYAGLLDDVPLLDGAAATSVELLGGLALAVSWLSADQRWRRRGLPLLLGGVTAGTGTIAASLWLTGTVTDAYPPSFGLWVGLGLAALAGLPFVLRAGSGRWRIGRLRLGPFERGRQVASVLAVPLTLVGALMLIDNEYGIWPQVGDLLGHSKALSGAALRQELPGLGEPAGAGGGAPVDEKPLPAKGVLAELDAASTTSHFTHRPGVVYLPPAYFGPDKADLPVLIMMVGAPGTPINWFRAGGAQATDDAYAAAHHGLAPVLVVVDQNGSATGDTECVDGPQGNAETYLTVDVPAFITTTLGIHPNAAKWGIVGYSEGGTCALDLVLGHPDIYRHIVDLCGDAKPTLGDHQHTVSALFGGSAAAEQAHDPTRMMAARRYPEVTAWFGAGTEDSRALTVSPRMAAAAAKAGITEHHLTVAGGHNWQFAGAAFAEILPQLCEQMACDVTGGAAAG